MSDIFAQDDDGSATRAREDPLVGSRTLHRHTKDVLDRVERGESVVILRYGRPTAALVPINEEQAQAIVFANSPELKGNSGDTPDAAAEAAAEPFAIASAEVEDDEHGEHWVVEVATFDGPLIEVETTDLATLANTQREMRSGVSALLARLDQQALMIASLVRGIGATGIAQEADEAGEGPGIT